MLKFQHVEDYLELLAGYEPGGTATIFNTSNYKFSLARYDVQIVENMAASTVWNSQALTDRQSELVVKLILKYRRQFANQGIDVSPVENPQFRIPVRKIDRTKKIWLDDNRIGLRFPYDRTLIDAVQEYKKTSHGDMTWDHEAKIWWLAVTEYNVNWVVTWGNCWEFDVDPQVQRFYEQILAAEQTPYEIKLIATAEGYTITNAAPSLIEYVENKLGGFGSDNLIKLIDYSGVLGYTYDTTLVPNTALDIFKDQRNTHIVPSDNNLDQIFDYAELTDRYPVCIYDPGLQGIDLSRFNEKDIVRFDTSGKTKTSEYNPYDVKVIYAHKIPATWNYPVPLLVTTRELLYGGKRMDWLNRAEKVIYYCNTLLRENN